MLEPLTQKEKERVRAEFTWLPNKRWCDRKEEKKESKNERTTESKTL